MDDNREPLLRKDGRKRMHQVHMFHFSWSRDHFYWSINEYLFHPDDLDEDVWASYNSLVTFVDSIIPAQSVIRRGAILYNKDWEPVLATRFISMNGLLNCSTYEEALALLGSILFYYSLFFCFPSHTEISLLFVAEKIPNAQECMVKLAMSNRTTQSKKGPLTKVL